jgi:SAM-dependent methyltransferase
VTGSGFEYVGTELDLFAHARRWKAAWIARVRPFVSGDVLEVGAGLGANTRDLQSGDVRSWTCLEPDARLAGRLREAVAAVPRCRVTVGDTGSIAGPFDCVLYADVLEHVEDDRAEASRAASLLRPGGRIVVLAPAHPSLYSPFDRAIGHYRRYDARSLRACMPPGCVETRLEYLDSAGMLLSLANRLLLRQSMPTLRQVMFWDRVVVPVSRVLDPLLGRRIGKSILAAWTLRGTPASGRAEDAR